MLGKAGQALYPEEKGVPPYDALILVDNTSALGNIRLRRFVEAVEKKPPNV